MKNGDKFNFLDVEVEFVESPLNKVDCTSCSFYYNPKYMCHTFNQQMKKESNTTGFFRFKEKI